MEMRPRWRPQRCRARFRVDLIVDETPLLEESMGSHNRTNVPCQIATASSVQLKSVPLPYPTAFVWRNAFSLDSESRCRFFFQQKFRNDAEANTFVGGSGAIYWKAKTIFHSEFQSTNQGDISHDSYQNIRSNGEETWNTASISRHYGSWHAVTYLFVVFLQPLLHRFKTLQRFRCREELGISAVILFWLKRDHFPRNFQIFTRDPTQFYGRFCFVYEWSQPAKGRAILLILVWYRYFSFDTNKYYIDTWHSILYRYRYLDCGIECEKLDAHFSQK